MTEVASEQPSVFELQLEELRDQYDAPKADRNVLFYTIADFIIDKLMDSRTGEEAARTIEAADEVLTWRMGRAGL